MVKYNNSVLLSICIPTYNRAEYLEKTILSIIRQKRFIETNDVEIVISDNCSEDNTRDISYKYVELFNGKIRYYRNSTNLVDANFEKVLSYGNGYFLKLNNDTLKHIDGSLDKILLTIEENKKDHNILFFSNGVLNLKKKSTSKDLNEFIENVSYWSTWIAAFGIWREDFINLKEFSRYSYLQLTQVDVLFRLINSRKIVYINNEPIFASSSPLRKGGYDFLTVFLDNYIYLLNEQLKSKTLSKNTFDNEKKKLLLVFILPWLVNVRLYPKKYYFECKNSFDRIFNYYKTDPLTLLIYIIKYYCRIFKSFTKTLINPLFVKIRKLK